MRSLLRNASGAGAAEFALVLPLLVLLLLGIIDVGRYMWTVNQAEKATQMGARMAAVTQAVSPDLINHDFASDDLPAGELIPASAMGTIVCTNAGCECDDEDGGPPCPFASGTVDSAALGNLVTRMSAILPSVTAANVVVSYSGSGFGFAGSPSIGGGGSVTQTMEVSPLISVSLRDMSFRPLSTLFIGSIGLPDSTTTLTAEDASGSFSE